MSNLSTRRSLVYWGLGLFFLLVGGPIYSSQWMADKDIHDVLDGLTTLFAILASGYVFLAYRKTRATATTRSP